MTAPSQTLDAALEAPADGRPPLRLVVVPTPQPPLVDPHLAHPLVLPGVPVPRPPLRPGPRLHPEGPVRRDGDFGPTYSQRADLPDVRVAGRRLLTLVLEAFGERRPMAQLRPVTSTGLFAAVSTRRRPAWCTEGRTPFAVGPLHVCEPVDGVAEISAVVRRNGRAHGVAARLEGLDGRWLCTALQIG